MYGLVNRAIEDMVCTQHGEAAWQEIKRKANIDTEVFISMDAYPDEMTYNMMDAAIDTLGMQKDEVLEAFGEHCITYLGELGYSRMFPLSGNCLRSFLINVDGFYSRMGVAFGSLKPPAFKCSEVCTHSLKLQYNAPRPGLTAIVIGLLKGMARFFETPVEVTQIARQERGAQYDEFLISFA